MDSKLESIHFSKFSNVVFYKFRFNKIFTYILIFVHISFWFRRCS